MSNPYLVLGGVVAGIVVASFGILQVPGWVAEAQDAAAQHDLATVVGAQAAAVSDLGHGAASFEELAQSDFANINLTPGVEIILDGTTASQGVVAVSQTGRAFARVNGETMYRAESLPMLLKNRAFACDWEEANLRDIGQEGGSCAPEPKGTTMVFTVRCDVDTDFRVPYRTFYGDVFWDANKTDVTEVKAGDGYSRFLKAGETHQFTIDGYVQSEWQESETKASRACIRSVDDITDKDGFLNGGSLFANMTNLTSVPKKVPQLTAYADSMFQNATSFNGEISGWNTDKVTSLSYAFADAKAFNQPLTGWNTENVTRFDGLFAGASRFNQPLTGWNTSNGTHFTSMFHGASDFNQPLDFDTTSARDFQFMFENALKFNQPLYWSTPQLQTMERAFYGARSFNGDISGWDTSEVTSMAFALSDTAFDGDLSRWNTSKVKDMSAMFQNAPFHGDLGSWETGNVEYMQSMFSNPEGNEVSPLRTDLSKWDTSKVKDMQLMFYNRPLAPLTGNSIGKWKTPEVTNMGEMFKNSNLTGDFSGWRTPKVTNLREMFADNPNFSSDLSKFETRNVEDMTGMFQNATAFNSDLTNWDVTNVQGYGLGYLFSGASSFNGDLKNWKMPNAKSLTSMFQDARSFNQDISAWDVSNIMDFSMMLYGSDSFDQDLTTWDVQPGADNWSFGFEGSKAPRWK